MLQQDDPPYLTVGTEVSAKYKGAFCEAKIRKVVRVVKCRVTFKSGHGTALLPDDLVKGTLRMGATVEAKHPDKNQFLEAVISKIQDCSQYTVVFDDGDITTLRRSALCLKSGRHFNESETLDQLPLTHPEHFSNPVVGGTRRGGGVRRRIPIVEEKEDSSEDESASSSQRGTKKKGEVDVDFGKVVCVEISDKKKGRDPWFPALVVSPAAQETVKIRVKDECLVRSFKDGRYYTVPKKEITEFCKDQPGRLDSGSSGLKSAVEKAVSYMDKDELPPHWDRDALFGAPGRGDDAFGDSDSETSEELLREKKDSFVAQLYKFMEERGSPINKGPTVCNKDLDLHKLYTVVVDNGGYSKVTNGGQWKNITGRLGFGSMPSTSTINLVKQAYKKYLVHFEEIDKKLGYNIHTSTTSKPRNSRSVYRTGGLMGATPSTSPSKAKKEKELKEEAKVAEEEKKEPAVVFEKKKFSIPEPEPDSDSDIASKKSDVSTSDEPRRSRSRQDSSRSKKDKEKDDEDRGSEKETKKKVKHAKNKEKEKEGTPVPKKEDDIMKAEPPSPATSSQSQSSKKGRGSQKKKKDEKVEEEPPVLIEEKTEQQDIPGAIGKEIKIEVGDKLSVFYPKGDRNVKYDAKVVDIDEKTGKYFVHYLGWNIRYDEWIFRGRIAENLSLRENYQSKAQGKGPAIAQPSDSPSRDDKEEGKERKGKKRGRSVTPAPTGIILSTPIVVESSVSVITIPVPPSSAGTRSKTANLTTSGSIKRKRNSTDKEDLPVKKKRSYKKSDKSAVIKAELVDSDTDSEEETFEAKSAPPPPQVLQVPIIPTSPTKKPKEKKEHNKKDVSEKDKVQQPPTDSNITRSEIKGVEKVVKSKTPPTTCSKTSSPPLLPGDQGKMDIYDFEDESIEAPKLKMFSPRSPDKKEEKEKKEVKVKDEIISVPVSVIERTMKSKEISRPIVATVSTPTSTPRPISSIVVGSKQPIASVIVPTPHHPIITSHPTPLVSTITKSPDMMRARLPTTPVSIEMTTPAKPTIAPHPQSASVPVIMKTPTYQSISVLQGLHAPHLQHPQKMNVYVPKTIMTPIPIRPASLAPIPIAPVVFTQTSGLSGSIVSAFTSPSSYPKDHGVLYPHRILSPEIHQPHYSQQQGIVLEQKPVELSGGGPTPPKKRRSPTKHRTPGEKDKPKEKRTPTKKEKSGEPKTPKKKKVGDIPLKSWKASMATSLQIPTPPKKLARNKINFPVVPAVSVTPLLTPISSSALLLAPSSTLATPSHAAISKINETISTLMQKTTAATPSEKEKIKAHHSFTHSHHQSPQYAPPAVFKSVISETSHYSQQQVQTPPREKSKDKSEIHSQKKPKLPRVIHSFPPIEETNVNVPVSTFIPNIPTPKAVQIAAIVSTAKATIPFPTYDVAGIPTLQPFPSSSKHSPQQLSYKQSTSTPTSTIVSPPSKRMEEQRIEKIEKRERKEEIHRPITPSFLQSHEVLESDDEEIVPLPKMRKERKSSKSSKKEQSRRSSKDMRLSPSKMHFHLEEKDKEESCSSLLCEEEIPGSPAPPERRERELDFGGKIKPEENKELEDDDEEDEEEDEEEEEEEEEHEYDGDEDDECSQSPKKGVNKEKKMKLERSQSLVVMHDITPPSTPDSTSFSIDTGSPHIDSGGRISPHGGDSSKSKDSSDNESGDNYKGYYSERSTGRKTSRVELPPSPLSKFPRSRATLPLISPGKKRRMIRKKSPTDDYAKQFGYRGIRSSSGRRIQSSIDVHEAIRGPPPPPVNLAKRPNSEKFNHLYPNLENVADPEERIILTVKCMQDIREQYLEVKGRIQTRDKKDRRRKRKMREKAAAERAARIEAGKATAIQGPS